MTVILSQPAETKRFIGHCEPCHRPVSAERDTTSDTIQLTCPACGDTLTAERIFGQYASMICNVECEGAGGPSCCCSCGGINHGGKWGEYREVTASEIAAWQATFAKRSAAATKRAEVKRETKRQSAADKYTAWLAECPQAVRDLVEADLAELAGFMYDMAWKLRRQEILSDRMIEVVEDITRRDAEIAARKAAEALNAKPVPTGKALRVRGTIVMTKYVESDFGGALKMLVLGDGWKVWSTVPAGTLPGCWGTDDIRALKGRTIEFTADVELGRNDPDPSFGYAKRPRKPVLIAA